VSGRQYEWRIRAARRVALTVEDKLLSPMFPAQSVEYRENQRVSYCKMLHTTCHSLVSIRTAFGAVWD
jgi:hypothetical protein